MSSCPHIDLFDPDNYIGGIRYDWLEELRRKEPVFWQSYPEAHDGGVWVITKHEDIDYISKNPQLFSSSERTCFLREPPPEGLETSRRLLINMDPPDHVRFRRIVRNAFTPRAVDAYEPRFRQIAKSIVDRVASKGECEFVEDVAAELPLIAICELMGIPIEDRKQFFDWTNIMIGADDPDLSTSPEAGFTARMKLHQYGAKLAEFHRRDPQDNIVGSLLDGVVDGEKLTEEQFSSFFLLLVVAGNETTRTVTSHGMRLLMAYPEQHKKLIDEPALIPGFIEEVLRFHTAVTQFTRTATEDIELKGKLIRKGQRVSMFYHSANRDEDVFDHPEMFDVTRPQRENVSRLHRAFGAGEHFCLGTHLARLELRVIFEELIPRLRNPEPCGEIVWLRSTLINGIKRLPIKFTPEPSP
ncbi:cytochrome P450 [Haliea sp.]|jgi:cholest-4-en-3-one 26-monooxygenase|uniref:cytochrome P450 n=1 Tax=Haliea sp. TaxID=1932666 RepID=UPI000C5AF0DF|nr:cytochrome P450 [Haliea sp.]MAD63070.1 cytochrome [Haliea sp.]MAY91537.1 cytochrome [Haliea sp.]MBK40520.1 cytochrome [Haliea sp.]MBP68619.1 cytochrome [Haliea sp.]|tara:strand:- start:1534 stop:2772 length:1239 start_codon:yes stop_codon:yes gene_type:complete